MSTTSPMSDKTMGSETMTDKTMTGDSMTGDSMTGDSMTGDSMTSDGMTAPAMAKGAYLTQEAYQMHMAERAGSKVVYFFHASWCPDCRATDEALTTGGVPDGLTVVKVDYDSATELRQKYGVTQQHTFVQVGPDGMELGKWSGLKDGAEIKAKTA